MTPITHYLNTDANIDTETRPVAGFVLRPWDPLRIAAVWRQGGPMGTVDMKAQRTLGFSIEIEPLLGNPAGVRVRF